MPLPKRQAQFMAAPTWIQLAFVQHQLETKKRAKLWMPPWKARIESHQVPRDQAHRIQCCRTCRWRQGRQDGTVSRHSRNLALNARVRTPQMGSETSSFLTDGRQCSGVRCNWKVQERMTRSECKLRLMCEGRWKRLVGSRPP